MSLLLAAFASLRRGPNGVLSGILPTDRLVDLVPSVARRSPSPGRPHDPRGITRPEAAYGFVSVIDEGSAWSGTAYGAATGVGTAQQVSVQ